jgi:hypothetical protein
MKFKMNDMNLIRYGESGGVRGGGGGGGGFRPMN